MITDIKNITSKSFKNYSSDEKFTNTNIIFGVNGSGKTGLVQWIVDQDSDNTRLFDSDYVHKNIEAIDEEKIRGVKLTIGEEAIKNAENLEEKKQELAETQANKKTKEDEINSKKADLFNILEDKLTEARNQFSLNTNINQKQNARTRPIEALQLWINEVDDTLDSHVGSSKELEATKKNLEAELQKASPVFEMSGEEYQELSNLLVGVINKPAEDITNEQIEWLKTGLSLHNLKVEKNGSAHRKTCKFCNNEFDTLEIANKIQEKISSDYAKKIKELNAFKSGIENIKIKATRLSSEIEHKDFDEKIEQVLKCIDDKLSDPANIVSTSQVSFEVLSGLDKTITTRKESLTAELTKVNSQISNIEKVAKSWIGSQLKSNTQCSTIKTEIQTKEKELEGLKTEIKAKEAEIKTLEEQISDLKPFKELVERQFNVLGLELVLEINDDGKSYVCKHKNPDIAITTKDLSEGERRLFGFLHFYFDLWEKPDKELKSAIEIIVFDDAITSLDSENRYYMTEQINNAVNVISNLGKQIFVLTHSSLDFHNLGYNSDNSKTKFWKISKGNSGSEINLVDKDSRKNYSDYYSSIFNAAFDFAKCPKNNLPDDFISFGNKTRLVLESHARTHYKIEMATKKSIDRLMDCYEIPDNEKQDFSHALDVVNSLSHGFTYLDDENNELSSQEVQTSIRKILHILYRKDSNHVKAMVGNKIDKENKDNIMKWLSPEDSQEVSS